MVAISVDNVAKSFGATRALDGVNVDIPAGSLFFLLGPSGCGKTTLLRTLAGFWRPDSGRIYFDGTDVTETPAHKRATAMMFQSYALWPHLNVAKNIGFGLKEQKYPADEVRRKVAEILRLVHMEGLGNRSINALSGGQQQRVALARALVVRPHCLLLDEPLSNLDANLRLEMRREIRRICKEFGLTAVYVTHDQKEALSIADALAVMEAGRVLQVGTPEAIYRRPNSCRVAKFIGEANFIVGCVGDATRDRVEVETEFGPFEGSIPDANWMPERNEAVILCIRPEAWKISPAPHQGTNTLGGRIEESAYLGEIAKYLLRTHDGTMVQVAELNPPAVRQPGEKPIHIHASPDDAVVLRAPQDASIDGGNGGGNVSGSGERIENDDRDTR